jgi:hypothetical protein
MATSPPARARAVMARRVVRRRLVSTSAV